VNFCPECGAALSGFPKFCSGCGARLAGLQSQPMRSDHPAARTLFVTTQASAPGLLGVLNSLGIQRPTIVSEDDETKRRAAIRDKLADQDYVCIVGSWSEVSPAYAPNPLDWRDGDQWCLTDSVFGCHEDPDESDLASYVPQVPVSRIPSTSPDVLARLLGAHELEGSVHSQFQFAVSAEQWQRATCEILRRCGLQDCQTHSSPAWDESDVASAMKAALRQRDTLFLFNVHGGADTPEWVGESESFPKDCPVVFNPDLIDDYAGGIILCEACYGGAMGYDSPSVVENVFERNGNGFVGCSVIAYGTEDETLSGADHIAVSCLKQLAEGLTLAQALTKAKQALLESYYEAEDEDAEVITKTILSFNAWGAPWIKLKTASVGRPQTVRDSRASRPSASDRLANMRSDLAARIADRRERIGSRMEGLRESYRQKLPLRSQMFLVGVDETLATIRGFRDASMIEGFLKSRGMSFSDCRLEKSSAAGQKKFRLSGATKNMDNRRAKDSFILIVDSVGRLKKTILSKGPSQ
jgi:hypothetical protein